MRRFFGTRLSQEEGVLAHQDLHHLVKVNRIREGEKILFRDERDPVEWLASVVSIGKEKVRVRLIEKRPLPPRFEITAIVPWLRRNKMEELVRIATQFGVSRMIFQRMDYGVSELKEKGKIYSRFEKVAREVLKQSGASHLPEVNFVDEWISAEIGEETLVFHPPMKGNFSLSRIKKARQLVIGPEGGFSQRELDFFEDRKVFFISLGKTILRTETSLAASLGFLKGILVNH